MEMDHATRLQPDSGTKTRRAAEFQPATYSEADNSVEVVWTTGAAVARFDWYDGRYYDETLSTVAADVRLDRLNQGGPVLLDHRVSVAALIGSIVPGSVRLSDGKGTARIRLTNSPDMADVVAKVREGHLRTVSVGYHVHAYERTERGAGERDQMHAVDWEPVEISLVTVPADPGAIIRSGSNAMPDITDPPTDDATQSREQPRRRGGVTEARIRDLCGRSNDLPRSFERRLLDMHQEDPLSERELQRELTEELVRIRAQPAIIENLDSSGYLGGGGEASQLRSRMEDALYARLSGKPPADHAREFMGARLLDLARGMMEARGERARWMSPNQIVQRMGAHTTSDFPTIMGSAARRYLLDVINAYPSPLKVLARPRRASDFRDLAVMRLSGNPALVHVPELGEFPHGSVVEKGEQYKLNTYGRIFGISRQALINDDLGAFQSVFSGWGRAAGELEAGYLAALINSVGPTMSDGNALYSAAHGNIAGAGAAISVASLSAARQAMRSQRDSDEGSTPLNIAPKYLVVGAAKETEAEQVLATLNATQTSDVNPFSGKLELLVDSRLTGNSWRLFAEPAAWPVLEVARLEGQEDVYVETRAGFEVDGIETKARVDIGAAAIDWRGTYMNPGA